MPDYLQQSQAPVSHAQWEILEQAAIDTARSMLIGRRFITLVGPFGPGVESVPNDVLTDSAEAQVDLLGRSESDAVQIARRTFLPLPLLYKDFWVHWRDVEANSRLGFPFDTGHAAVAASAVALAEDRLIFQGDDQLGISGLLTVEGNQRLSLRDWGESGAGFADVVDATRRLLDAGFPGPYTVVVSPLLYAELNRIFDNTGVLEIEQVQKLARGGVFPSPVLPEPTAVVIDGGADNLDLAVAVDLALAFLTTEGLNLKFRVLESLVPRIHRPGAIAVLRGGPSGPPGNRRGGNQGNGEG